MSIRTLLQCCIVLGLLCVAPLTMLWSTAWAGPPSDAADHEIDQAVIKLNRATGATIAHINATYGTTTIAEVVDGADIYLLQLPPRANMRDTIERMRRNPHLLYAEPNYISEIPEGSGNGTWAWGGLDAEPFDTQYAVDMLGLSLAHAISDGEGTVVAVLDTGVQLDHPELAGSLTVERFDFVDNDGLPADEANGLDDDDDGAVDEGTGHGTHVAGILRLVAPGARIMPLRVLDSDGRGTISMIAAAILYAANHGANVINLSLGTPHQSRLLTEVIEEVTEEGSIVVAAAGNLNSDVPQYPAAEERVLGVTSVGPTGEKSVFANFGSWVDFAAPGESIYSTFLDSGYAWGSGTSMATPFVAGQATLIRSVAPLLPVEDVGSLIRMTAQPLDLLNPEFAGQLGAGLINIGGSMVAIGAAPNQPPVCSTATPSIETVWPPDHQFVPVNVLGVTDPDGDLVSMAIDSIWQDEPVGSGKYSPDGAGVGTYTAEVRAERDEAGNGRVYHIDFTANDGRGGSCSGGVLVGVLREQGNGRVPVDDGTLYDSTVAAP